MMKAIQKSSENTNTKTKTMTKTTTKTKTQKKCLKHPTYAIFLKSWWLTHSKYDDRYLTLVILFTPVTLVTLVTLFQPYIQLYRAECITVSGFLSVNRLCHLWYRQALESATLALDRGQQGGQGRSDILLAVTDHILVFWRNSLHSFGKPFP